MTLLQEIQRWRRDGGPSPFSIQAKDPEYSCLSKKLASDGSRFYLYSIPEVYFTNRELQIARLMLVNKQSYKALAEELKISPRTVEFYIQSLRNKFHVPNKILLVRKLAELRERGEL